MVLVYTCLLVCAEHVGRGSRRSRVILKLVGGYMLEERKMFWATDWGELLSCDTKSLRCLGVGA